MKSAVTVSLVPEARGGPFVYWDGLEAAAVAAARCGFDAVEIFPRGPGEIDRARVAALVAEHGLAVAAVGTGAGWVVHKLQLCHPDRAVRTEAKQFIRGVIELGAAWGAPAIIGSMQGRSEGSVSPSQALDWLCESLTELGAVAGDLGQVLLYEPLNRYETNLFNRLEPAAEMVRGLTGGHVRLLADLFHQNIEEVSIPAALAEVHDVIGHVHLADSNRRAAGFGHTDLQACVDVLKRVGYAGYLSAEVLPLPDADAAAEQTMRAFRQLTGRSA